MTTTPSSIEYATVPGSGLASPARIQKPVPGILDVIAVVSNPVRYNSRYTLYRNFERHMIASGVRMWTVECAFGNRPFEVTEEGNPQHIQVRTDHEVWLKENLANIGIHRLPRDSQYIALLDADIHFVNPTWAQDVIHALQHYQVVQPWSEAYDLGPNSEVLVDIGKDGIPRTAFKSFCYSHVHGIRRNKDGGAGYYGGTPDTHSRSNVRFWHHPGFGWAYRRSALNALGGVFDLAVVGEADYIMAKSYVGEAEHVLYPGISPGYRKAVMDWQDRASKIRQNIGYVTGTITHSFHGGKKNRAYWSRCALLSKTQFDPTTDLKKDCEGLWQLVDHGDARSVMLRDGLRDYFRGRLEDSDQV